MPEKQASIHRVDDDFVPKRHPLNQKLHKPPEEDADPLGGTETSTLPCAPTPTCTNSAKPPTAGTSLSMSLEVSLLALDPAQIHSAVQARSTHSMKQAGSNTQAHAPTPLESRSTAAANTPAKPNPPGPRSRSNSSPHADSLKQYEAKILVLRDFLKPCRTHTEFKRHFNPYIQVGIGAEGYCRHWIPRTSDIPTGLVVKAVAVNHLKLPDEVGILERIKSHRHTNIVEYLGWYDDPEPGRDWILLGYCDKKDACEWK